MRTMAFTLFALAVASAAAETVSLKSPDGRNEICLDTEPTLSYRILRGGMPLTASTPVALEIAERGLLGGAGLKIVSKTPANRAGTLPTPAYKKAAVDETARGVRVSFGEWAIDLVARNDGVAYRFATAYGTNVVTVVSEQAPLVFASGEQTVYAAPNLVAGLGDPLQCSWQGVYAKHAVKDAPKDFSDRKNGLWYAPLTFVYPDGKAMCVTESDLRGYPGWNFQGADDGRSLKALFAAYPKKTVHADKGQSVFSDQPLRYQRVVEREGFLARTAGARTYPWRAFMLADSVAKLVESDLVHALAAPNAVGDVSWVKPGKVAWDWWNSWNVTGVGFRAGVNTRTYEYYIDFAAKAGLEYVILDEGWSEKLRILDVNPEVDVPHLVRYGAERGVGLILWAAWSQFLGREEQVVERYAKMGAKGFKIDFLDRDDKAVLDSIERISRIAARHRMVLVWHGMFKPTGLQRTYPNILNFEGVHGLETLRSRAEEDFPEKDCTLVFTRMLAGPMDYTPGAMRNFCRGCYKPTPRLPGSYGTRVHQMALMTLFEAPVQMLCDSPTQYLRNAECFAFMAAVPVVWDATVALGGEMDAYAALARRKGDDWWAAAICGWKPRAAVIDTSFLGEGSWTAEIFADGVNADRDAVDYVRVVRDVKAGEKIPASLMPGGGWTARFTRKRK